MQSISSLENLRKGEDIYVVGGGKSMDYYPSGFFGSRCVLAVNQASILVNPTFVIRKEGADIRKAPVISSMHRAGCLDLGMNRSDYMFDHNHNMLSVIERADLHPYGDKIVVSWSTITSAIHLAAYMGARAVFLAGHDCATIDGEQTANDYYLGVNRITQPQDYSNWLKCIASQTIWMREYLYSEYKIPLISLSPFVGLKHEGHIIE